MATKHFFSFSALFLSAFFLVTVGCQGEAKAPVPKGPIDTTIASQLQGKTRISNSEKYSVTHEYKGQEFTANWELGNALKKSSQLQLKPPADWSEGDLYLALEIVLNGHATKPWYPAIDDTVLRLMREALKDDNNRATGYAPETPYDVAVVVKQHTSEWFLQVKVQILDENGMALGF
jgi:hypothetical protein